MAFAQHRRRFGDMLAQLGGDRRAVDELGKLTDGALLLALVRDLEVHLDVGAGGGGVLLERLVGLHLRAAVHDVEDGPLRIAHDDGLADLTGGGAGRAALVVVAGAVLLRRRAADGEEDEERDGGELEAGLAEHASCTSRGREPSPRGRRLLRSA